MGQINPLNSTTMDQDQNTGVGGTEVNSPTPTPSTSNAGAQTPLALIGAGIAVLILIILGWYMMHGSTPAADSIPQPIQEQNTAPSPIDNTHASATTAPDAATVALSTQGTSDEVTAIDADVQATDLTSLNDIDKI